MYACRLYNRNNFAEVYIMDAVDEQKLSNLTI